MLQRSVPSTAESLPVVGLGTWQTFDVPPSHQSSREAILCRFVDMGGRVVDSSPMYGRSETVVGDAAQSAALHDRLFMATKVWTRGQRAGAAQMEDSLARLRTPRIDLMQVHNLVDVDAHLATLAEWKAAGRIRYVGVTHYTVEAHAQLEPFLRRGDIDFVQFNYSLAVRDAERRLLPLAAEHGVATLINRPFESGVMVARARDLALPSWAQDLRCTTWPQVFLKYVISHPAVTCAIPATSSIDHLEQNMAAGEGPLPDDQLRAAMARDWDRLAG
jgi:aryl-alcohol dehydrogenase-like predicted oxidoreductase